jgi:hypothetical protein
MVRRAGSTFCTAKPASDTAAPSARSCGGICVGEIGVIAALVGAAATCSSSCGGSMAS